MYIVKTILEKHLKNKIDELNKTDQLFCKVRWDTSNSEMERKMARDLSNETTARRRELEELLLFIEKMQITAAQYEQLIKPS